MPFSTGNLITAAEYNILAETVNEVFADNHSNVEYAVTYTGSTPNNGSVSNVIFQIHEGDFPAVSPGTGPFALSPSPVLGDFIVVQIGDETRISGYFIDYGTSEITFSNPLPIATRVVVYNRTVHRFGWGNAGAPVPILEEAVILGADFNAVIDRTNIMLDHVGDNTGLSRVSATTKIFAIDAQQVESAVEGSIISGGTHLTVDLATSTNVTSTSRIDPWVNQLQSDFSYTFSDYNEARYFFNSGGELRCNIEMTGNPLNSGYANWNQVVDQMGTLIFNHDNTTQSGTGGISNAKGFYHLTTDWQLIFTSASPGSPYGGYSDYSNLVLEFYARYIEVGSNHQVQLRVVMDDTAYHSDAVEGTTTINIGYLNSDNIVDNTASLSITPPTVAIIDDLNTGNDS